ncbi:MAG: acyl-ACP--UDP-N-acetylglucosamine O-acyltransferase [Phycisphaerales bacterium]|nr:acyl-ACP--UDP-N-acetylglucosamine O-acyltransferase [Phycisphaerales bacterium]
MAKIAPTATVDTKAELGNDIEIGPGCHVGADVQIGPGCRLIANVTIMGNTTVGRGNTFYPCCVIGASPQDLKYEGTNTKLIIGNDNIFRENVTAHTGTELGGGVTEIGNQNQFQVGAHIAHDVVVGNHCILSNLVQIAGHVQIEDHVTVSGLSGVQQFVTLGRYCFITGAGRCTADIPPYVIFGHDGIIQGINVKGLSRWGFSDDSIQQLRDICKVLYPRRNQTPNHYRLRNLYGIIPWGREEANGVATVARRLRDAEAHGTNDEHCRYMIDFLKRSIYDGIHGRYLESCRRDNGSAPARFYKGGNGNVRSQRQ